MSPRRGVVVVLLSALAGAGAAGAAPPAADRAADAARFERGMTQVVESPLALSDTVVDEAERLGAIGVPVGVVKGVGRVIGQQATGVADVVGAMGDARPAWRADGERAIAAVCNGRSLRIR